MLIDCETCLARDIGCADCVISVLFATPGQSADLDADEQAAVDSLAAVGLVPPLRLLQIDSHGDVVPVPWLGAVRRRRPA